jgi:D-alanyl-D-alanine carboxypeptidase
MKELESKLSEGTMAKILIPLIFISLFIWLIMNRNDNMEITIEGILAQELQHHRTPSVQYVFFNASDIIYEFREGMADINRMLKVDHNTTYHAYSITKTFTALGILQLAEKNLIDLDKPANDYLPDQTITGDITIKHLLSHTSGLADPIPLKWIHLKEEHESFDRDSYFDPMFKDLKRKTASVNKFRYSNLGYVLLGQIIEVVSGVEYEQYITENIINKLGLQPHELNFSIQYDLLHAKGYHLKNSFTMLALGLFLDKKKYMEAPVGRWKPFRANYVNGAPYGGLIGNTNGFVKYAQALLGDSSCLISNKYRTLLFNETRLDSGKPTGMCLSWFTGEIDSHHYVAHAGGGGGYYCELRLYLELNLGSFIVFNRSGFSDARFLDKVDKYHLQKMQKI